MDWTGELDWWTDIFGAKITLCMSLMRPHSPVGLDILLFIDLDTLISLFKNIRTGICSAYIARHYQSEV